MKRAKTIAINKRIPREYYKHLPWNVTPKFSSEELDKALKYVKEEANNLETKYRQIGEYIRQFHDFNKRIVLTKLCNEIDDVCKLIYKELIDRYIIYNLPEESFILAINVFISHYLYNGLPKMLLPFCLFTVIIDEYNILLTRCKRWLNDMEKDGESYKKISSYYNKDIIKPFNSIPSKKPKYKKEYSFSMLNFFNRKYHPQKNSELYENIFRQLVDFFSKNILSLDDNTQSIKVKKTNSTTIKVISYSMFGLFFLFDDQERDKYEAYSDDIYDALYLYYETYILEKLASDLKSNIVNDKINEYKKPFFDFLYNLYYYEFCDMMGRFIKDPNALVTELINDKFKSCECYSTNPELFKQYLYLRLQIILFADFHNSDNMFDAPKIIISNNDIDKYIKQHIAEFLSTKEDDNNESINEESAVKEECIGDDANKESVVKEENISDDANKKGKIQEEDIDEFIADNFIISDGVDEKYSIDQYLNNITSNYKMKKPQYDKSVIIKCINQYFKELLIKYTDNYIDHPFEMLTQNAQEYIVDYPSQIYSKSAKLHQKCIEMKAKTLTIQYKDKLFEEHLEELVSNCSSAVDFKETSQ